MKRILLAAALTLPVAAFASVLATVENDGNGRIELTGTPIPPGAVKVAPECAGRFVAKSWGRTSADMYGCWTGDSSARTILIYWPSSNAHRTYWAEDFTPTEAAKRGLR